MRRQRRQGRGRGRCSKRDGSKREVARETVAREKVARDCSMRDGSKRDGRKREVARERVAREWRSPRSTLYLGVVVRLAVGEALLHKFLHARIGRLHGRERRERRVKLFERDEGVAGGGVRAKLVDALAHGLKKASAASSDAGIVRVHAPCKGRVAFATQARVGDVRHCSLSAVS